MEQAIKTFGIIGGDKRQLYLAESLLSDGCGVRLCGFEALGGAGGPDCEQVIRQSDAIILPLPCVRDGKTLNAPFALRDVVFSDGAQKALCRKPVFVGMRDRLLRAYPALQRAEVYDYAAREDFAVRNAVPTAEGAVSLAMQRFEGTIFGSRALVTGFGRIGKVLSRLLCSLGAEVTVCARKSGDLAMIESLGCRPRAFCELTEARGFDLIFNTVPALLFDEALLRRTEPTALLIDLASLPGGVDLEAAERLGVDAHRALALPGKCAPRAAGEIIKKTVLSIIEEVQR